MPFIEGLPEWNAPGVEPPETMRNIGWEAGKRPPADYWNWQMNKTFKALQELQQKAAEAADVGDMSTVPTTAKDAAGAIAELYEDIESIGAGTDYVRQPGYAVTTGTAAVYEVSTTPAPTAYVEGMRITVKAHVANTGAAKINWNGLGARDILTSKGQQLTANKFVAGGVYSLVYNGTAFILQGEGGGGNATAAQLLAGKTATVDSGDIVGTMPLKDDTNGTVGGNVKWHASPETVALVTDPGRIFVRPVPLGNTNPVAFNGSCWLVGEDPDFIPDNFLSSKTMFGVQGAIPDKSGLQAGNGYASALSVKADGGGNLVFEAPTGYYKSGLNSLGYGNVIANDPDFVAANFPANKNIFGVQGAMPVHQGQHYPTLGYNANLEAGRIYLRVPTGWFADGVHVYADDSEFVAANILNTANIFGIQGTASGRKYASGNVSAVNGVITVNGLGFNPSAMLFRIGVGGGTIYYVYYTANPNVAMGANNVIVVGNTSGGISGATNLNAGVTIITGGFTMQYSGFNNNGGYYECWG